MDSFDWGSSIDDVDLIVPTKADRFIKKGDIVGIYEPLLIIPDNESGAKDSCQRCCRSMEQLPGALVGLDADESITLSDQFSCDVCGASTQFCCVECQKDERLLNVHTLPCRSWKKPVVDGTYTNEEEDASKSSMWRSLLRYIRQIQNSNSFVEAAVHHVTCLLFYIAEVGQEAESSLVKSFLNQIIASTMKNPRFSDLYDANDYSSDEVWSLLHAALVNDVGFNGFRQKRGCPIMSSNNFSTVFKFLSSSCCFLLSIKSKLQIYASENLRRLGGEDVSKVVKVFDEIGVIEYAFKEDGIERSKLNESDFGLGTILKTSTVVDHRKCARISQVADEQAIDEASPFYKSRHNFLVVCPQLSIIHSCIPNCAIVGVNSDKNRLLLKIIALCDIDEGELLTEAKVDISEPINERRRHLMNIYGTKYSCSCFRCKFELNELDINKINPKQYKFLGDIAMQQGRFIDAIQIYDDVFKIDSANADLFHARCAARLSYGDYTDAQNLWEEGAIIFPEHDGISLQCIKYAAYSEIQYTQEEVKVETSTIKEVIPNMCYLTISVLTRDECRLAIKFGEDAARERVGGWTTSRHYAVPTTDLPVHEIPSLLNWFNNILSSRLRSLLAFQFGEDEVGVNGSRIIVHDAFIVRYNATEQKHLPVHRDESTYSFTIALNDHSEYDGGGTYIADIGLSIRPNIGSVLSFRGDKLLHGGDPVTNGIRYIIVCFCYVNNDNCTNDSKKSIKRKHVEHCFGKTFKKDRSGQTSAEKPIFSFEFKL